LFSLH